VAPEWRGAAGDALVATDVAHAGVVAADVGRAGRAGHGAGGLDGAGVIGAVHAALAAGDVPGHAVDGAGRPDSGPA
jgi:hypothetical protein